MATIGKVSAVFTASTSGLTVGVGRAADSMGRIQRATDRVSRSMSILAGIEITRVFASVVGTAASYVRSLVDMGRAQAEVIDQTSKMAAKTGMTYGQFAGLALAGQLAGIEMGAMSQAATKLDVALVKAKNGSAQAQNAFATLGLNVAQLDAMSPDERFQAVAEAISQLPTAAERAAAAVAIFGRSGAQLLPLFEDGADAIQRAREQAERLGLALTNAQGRDVEAMNDSFTLAYEAVKGIVGQVTAYLAPGITAAAEAFTAFIGDIGGANIGRFIGEAIMDGAEFLARIADWFIGNMKSVWEYVGSVGKYWGSVIDTLSRVGSFLQGVFYAFEAALLGIVKQYSGLVSVLAQGIKAASYVNPAIRLAMGSSIDAFAAGAHEFDQQIGASMSSHAEDAAAAFGAAFASEAPAFGELAAGPLTQMLEVARARADESRAKTDEAAKKAAGVPALSVEAIAPQAVKALDSRSSEGVAEMFRLMRGQGDTATERTATATERTADATENLLGLMEDDAPFGVD